MKADLAKPCPACSAQPGEPCVTGNGRPTSEHNARVLGVMSGPINKVRPKRQRA